ncbi:MAG: TIGR00282 family metallophosphoesterase [Candidatus Paracaedimonas acanthamoebae]|uniref:TIGR00282 family metallophosphoesterase n=1 Tax=Candidatus Paracaedimonas acanthamoebae TaxID=244581 RepID=A0A8J7TST8_9PROT|nr:TIGR00282 family metallophosphoesterase [Candidatus Paracaedimonas acanthamoebae]
MKILTCGDVVGRKGRSAIMEYVPKLRSELQLDAVIVNGENAAGGFGITQEIAHEFFNVGVDVITTGNHAWDQKCINNFFPKDSRLLRPINYKPEKPGAGITKIKLHKNKTIVVINIMGKLFMPPPVVADPFFTITSVLKEYRLKQNNVDAIIIDIHAEANSEKIALANYVDGQVSAVVGTHTHVPTADARILPKGTAYQTDLGMCGPYDSVLGMQKELSISRFLGTIPSPHMKPANGEPTLCGAVITTDDATGLAINIMAIKIGGLLNSSY